MYSPASTASDAAAFGFTLDKFNAVFDEITDIWPCSFSAYIVFEAMGTQWRMGSAGMGGSMPCGLEYTALPVVMRLQGIPEEEQNEVFADIRVMEGEALQTMREK